MNSPPLPDPELACPPPVSLRWWLGPALAGLAAGFAALAVDLPLSRACLKMRRENDGGPLSDTFREMLVNSEPMAHAIGVTFVLTAVFLLDPARRWTMPRLVLLVASGGLAASAGKLFVSRRRPINFQTQEHILDSFRGWFEWGAGGNVVRSTPSAHAATAVALAIGLCWLYPRGRALFIALAVFASLQRIEASMHFLSDVFWGAAVGWFVGYGVLSHRLTPAAFNRWEARNREQ